MGYREISFSVRCLFELFNEGEDGGAAWLICEDTCGDDDFSGFLLKGDAGERIPAALADGDVLRQQGDTQACFQGREEAGDAIELSGDLCLELVLAEEAGNAFPILRVVFALVEQELFTGEIGQGEGFFAGQGMAGFQDEPPAVGAEGFPADVLLGAGRGQDEIELSGCQARAHLRR